MSFEGYTQIGRTLTRVRWEESNVVVDFAETIPAQSIAVDKLLSETDEVYENFKPENVPLCEACREE